MRTKPHPFVEVDHSFRSIGFKDAEILLLKAELNAAIGAAIHRRKLRQADAAEITGLSQPDISRLVNGRFGRHSLDALLQAALNLGLSFRLGAIDFPSHHAERGRVLVDRPFMARYDPYTGEERADRQEASKSNKRSRRVAVAAHRERPRKRHIGRAKASGGDKRIAAGKRGSHRHPAAAE
jgi:predicted XRE-type DNA-binding protein